MHDVPAHYPTALVCKAGPRPHATSRFPPLTPSPSPLPPTRSGTENLVQVTDLMPGTTYQFRVTAINALGGSPWSPVGSATTLPSVPLAPGAPTVAACSSHSLQLSWREPYGQGAPVTSYTVNMARLPQGSCGGGGGGYSGGGGAGHRHTNGHHKAASSAGSDHGSAGGRPRQQPAAGACMVAHWLLTRADH